MGYKMASKAFAEFIGTAVLMAAFTNVSVNNSSIGALAVASSLMIAIYQLGAVSGGHFNPAVSICLSIMSCLGWGEFAAADCAIYIVSQLFGAACSAFLNTSIWLTHTGATYPSGVIPAVNVTHPWKNDVLRDYIKNEGSASVMGSEIVYTFLLVFVILNTATCNDTGKEKNYYAPMAIGFVIVAAASAVGGISGCCLNPAVSFGATLMNLCYGKMAEPFRGLGYWLVYSLAELAGGLVGIAFFAVTRKHLLDSVDEDEKPKPSMVSKLVSEFLGTFVLCLTVQLVVNAPASPIGCVGIAASLMVMIYSLGAVSGANFNPAVSLGLLISQALAPVDFLLYVVAQLLGAAASYGIAALILWGKMKDSLVGSTVEVVNNVTHPLLNITVSVTQMVNPSVGSGDWFSIAVSEIIFTTLLVFTVLNVAVADAPNQHYGLAIGFVIVVGAASVGSVSGGAFNPAVTLALDLNGLTVTGGTFGWGFLYMLFQLIAGAIAALLFKAVRCVDDDGYEGMEEE